MRKALWIAVAGVTIAVAGATSAKSGDDVKDVIERVLNAAGGWDRLSQPRAYTYKDHHTTKTAERERVNDKTYYIEPPNKFRLEDESQNDGMPVKLIRVVNGTKGWESVNGKRVEYLPTQQPRVFDPQEGWGYKVVCRLKDPKSVVTAIGDARLGDREVYGVKLIWGTGPAAITARMWFDKKTSLLIRSEQLSKAGNVLMEINWEDYRMIDGIAAPHRATIKSRVPGGEVQTHVFSDFKFVDKFDPKLFDVP